jgi:hypothetical protein
MSPSPHCSNRRRGRRRYRSGARLVAAAFRPPGSCCSGDVQIAALFQPAAGTPPLQKMNQPGESDNVPAFPALSKRGARRAIQRAFVLVGRDRRIRQHLREIHLTTLWLLEDWGLEWTVILDHGRIDFHRGRVAKPNLTFAWRTAEAFFSQIETGNPVEGAFELVGDAAWKKLCEPVYEAFCGSLRGVLRNPIDDAGERLL